MKLVSFVRKKFMLKNFRVGKMPKNFETPCIPFFSKKGNDESSPKNLLFPNSRLFSKNLKTKLYALAFEVSNISSIPRTFSHLL
jgi:hypothetical protein